MSELIILCAGAAVDAPEPAGDRTAALPPDAFSQAGQALVPPLASGALARLLRRAALAADHHDAAPLPRELPEEGWLRARYGLPEDDAVAAWACAAHGLSAPRWRATPVHVEVGRHQIVLSDPLALELTPADAQALADAARPVLDDAGFGLTLAKPGSWFLDGNADWSLQARAWTMAVGRSIDGYLPSGPQARAWRRVFTELQMAWHEHPANLQRTARGLPPINALWLDGCARGTPAGPTTTVFTEDAALAGLVCAAGGRHQAGSARTLQPGALSAATGDLLIDADFWRASRRIGDSLGWAQAWQDFDAWLAALLGSSGLPASVERLRLVASAERRCVQLVLGRSDRWRLLRRFDGPATLLRPSSLPR